ncbi:hypothetical protein V1512DRAFT_261480 [Lipomyces arxii]|uniref:uncharacterized protein n=1 Tax=Lipomyces arxii TaxID=56418 RepID=UPI0034CD6653
MNSSQYLTSYGWTPGTGFKKDSLAKPILVRHKKDTKGLGNKSLDHETWWERVFDGQLQNLDVYKKRPDGPAQDFASVRTARNSPLYSMFVKGEGLDGSVEPKKITVEKDVITRTKTIGADLSVTEVVTEVDSIVSVEVSNKSKKHKGKKKRHDAVKSSTKAANEAAWVRALLKDAQKKKKKSHNDQKAKKED